MQPIVAQKDYSPGSAFSTAEVFHSLSLMKVIAALLWIWPLTYELLTEQLEWKQESARSKVSYKDISIIFKLKRKREENLRPIILLTHIMSNSAGSHTFTSETSLHARG